MTLKPDAADASFQAPHESLPHAVLAHLCGFVRIIPPGESRMTSPETELPEAQSRAIANAVREALARRRISRQKLADDARISISTLEKALSGRRPFTLATTIRLEEALGAPLRTAASTAQPDIATRHAPDALGAIRTRRSPGSKAATSRCALPSASPGRCLPIAPRSSGQRRLRARLPRGGTLGRALRPNGPSLGATPVGRGLSRHPLARAYRLVVLGRPTIEGEMYGLLTTLQSGRGSQLTPVAAPIALIPERRLSAPMPYGRLAPGTPDFAACRELLRRVGDDGFAAFFACPA